MTTASLFMCLLSQSQLVDKYTLTFYQDNFVVRHGTEVVRVPVKAAPEVPKQSIMYRKNKTFAVWDERGLTVRSGRRVYSTKLAEIAVSPRIQKRAEILNTLSLIKQGVRSKNASGLSGSRRIGEDVYFLVRWDQKDGKPWLEALVKVNLMELAPKPQLMGKFDGLSTSKKAIDDRLALADGKPAVVCQTEAGWGVSTFAPADRMFDFRKVGDELLGWSTTGYFIEKSSYGTCVGGSLNLKDFTRHTLFEDRGTARFVDPNKPMLAVIRKEDGPVLRNLESGAEMKLPASCALRRAGKWVIVWTPFDAPKSAKLYSPENWNDLARWFKGLE